VVALGTQGRDIKDLIRIRLKLLVLTLLAIKPSHGYELSKAIEEITLGAVRAGPGSLYPLLRELQEEGLVEEREEADGKRVKRVYALSERGWRVLADTLEVAKTVLSNVLSLIDMAARAVKNRVGGCVPSDVVRYLADLQRTISIMLEQARARQCVE